MIGLHQIAWGELHHAYGPAVDVPGHLRALRSPDPAVRGHALNALSISVCHQGTRWEVSPAVIPFLVALIDDPRTPARGDLLHLLTSITVGTRRDDDLPFDPARQFAATGLLDGRDTTALVNRFHLGDDEYTDEETTLLDAVAVGWAADCYRRCAGFAPTISRWTGDPDDEVAARAAALTAWFPSDPATVTTWLTVPAGREQPRSSANLALAHCPTQDTAVDAALRDMTVTGSDLVAVTAAVAVAYRKGPEIDPSALGTLIDASEQESLRDVTGWNRATRGFVMRALRHTGL
ncbi:hypothetical protein [Actinoplanes subglobosus]|uniref:HEAT repeat domain-containing protein n=1 Tax=Actinoplanes subglobosus TaxID=1547892 RepID=A0ABV8IVT2_9ACTN